MPLKYCRPCRRKHEADVDWACPWANPDLKAKVLSRSLPKEDAPRPIGARLRKPKVIVEAEIPVPVKKTPKKAPKRAANKGESPAKKAAKKTVKTTKSDEEIAAEAARVELEQQKKEHQRCRQDRGPDTVLTNSNDTS